MLDVARAVKASTEPPLRPEFGFVCRVLMHVCAPVGARGQPSKCSSTTEPSLQPLHLVF